MQPTGAGGYAQMSIGTVGATASVIGFDALYGTEDHSYRVTFAGGGRALYTQRGGSEGSYYYHTDAAGSGNTGEHYRYFLEKVTSLPVTISSVGYATLYSPVALTIPDGITAYAATDNGGDNLVLTAIDGGVIPANTGVLLAGEAGPYSFAITTGGSASSELTGSVTAISRPANSYILSDGDYGCGFYKDGPTSIPGFKAYLPAEAVGAAKGFLSFDFSDVDGIESLSNILQSDNRTIYNLAGQRIEKLQRGVNIVNGKKVLVK